MNTYRAGEGTSERGSESHLEARTEEDCTGVQGMAGSGIGTEESFRALTFCSSVFKRGEVREGFGFSFLTLLGIEPSAPHMLGEHSPLSYNPSPGKDLLFFLFDGTGG